jgi:hypothetical protein
VFRVSGQLIEDVVGGREEKDVGVWRIEGRRSVSGQERRPRLSAVFAKAAVRSAILKVSATGPQPPELIDAMRRHFASTMLQQ